MKQVIRSKSINRYKYTIKFTKRNKLMYKLNNFD